MPKHMPHGDYTEDPGELRGRIEACAAEAGVDFVGGLALDVGGRDGLYVPMIRDMGFDPVKIVDPSERQLDSAVRRGVIDEDDKFWGKLERYVESGGSEADAAFVLNMQPRLSYDEGFVRALGRVVRPGGLVIASMGEPHTSFKFRVTAQRVHGPGFTRLGVAPPTAGLLPYRSGPNCYIQLWQRART